MTASDELGAVREQRARVARRVDDVEREAREAAAAVHEASAALSDLERRGAPAGKRRELEATLPHRRFRDLGARLFDDSGADALRTSIAKACAAAGVPLFSPHDLRHRRISLLHLRGVPWARIGEMVGQKDLAVTANTYTYILADETDLDYAQLLAEAS